MFLEKDFSGLNLIYVHLNRIINQYDLNMIYITGPGHGGPLDQLFRGYGYKPYFIGGNDPMKVHQLPAATLDTIVAEIKDIQMRARSRGHYLC
ncbi:MAG: hypothetical protein C4560_09390 [Nitrospiraceae bacterium]|nr:MAG: hypothetical protein C4560_09390 [Nitrospiraceae bacterium]